MSLSNGIESPLFTSRRIQVIFLFLDAALAIPSVAFQQCFSFVILRTRLSVPPFPCLTFAMSPTLHTICPARFDPYV